MNQKARYNFKDKTCNIHKIPLKKFKSPAGSIVYHCVASDVPDPCTTPEMLNRFVLLVNG